MAKNICKKRAPQEARFPLSSRKIKAHPPHPPEQQTGSPHTPPSILPEPNPKLPTAAVPNCRPNRHLHHQPPPAPPIPNVAHRPHPLLFLTLTALILCQCEQIGTAILGKTITNDVIHAARESHNWYEYLPEKSPGFCLRTTRTLIWRDPLLRLGYWRGVDPDTPTRVYMEARGNVFIIYPGYTWDGMTIGTTTCADLTSTLLHDALYHALAAGAHFPRLQADRAFLRQRRQIGLPRTRFEYSAIRLFGWPSSRPHGTPTLRVIPSAPGDPTSYPLSSNPQPLRQ